jgi:iron complex outermembrane receptor protein
LRTRTTTIIGGPSNGNLAAVGAQVFPGFKPADAGAHDRDSKAIYVDFEQNLTDRWLVSLAGRFEDYSDFGNNSTVKFATRFELTDQLRCDQSTRRPLREHHHGLERAVDQRDQPLDFPIIVRRFVGERAQPPEP